MAVTSRPKANCREARRFAWFCRSSHKRNSKNFNHLNWPAASSSHDQNTKNSWANDRAGIERERVGADDDQWRRRDVSIPDLFQVVRGIREGRPFSPFQLSIDRIGRRAKTNPGANRGFRRVGWANERRQSEQSARETFAHSNGGRCGCGRLQFARKSSVEA